MPEVGKVSRWADERVGKVANTQRALAGQQQIKPIKQTERDYFSIPQLVVRSFKCLKVQMSENQ